MNERDAQRVMLVRSFESPLAAPWTELDTQSVTREAQRSVGADAPFDRFLATRANLAWDRLSQRLPAIARLDVIGTWRWVAGSAVILAFLAGIASDATTSGERIHVLAPPLLLLLTWNLVVYASALFSRGGTWRKALGELWATLQLRAAAGSPPLLRHAAQWASSAQALHTSRIAFALHACAAAFACGALSSLYVRGLVFEFRAGWDSTFLDANAVHAIVCAVLTPASLVSGLAMPDVNGIAALRFSSGGGENAARWIHWYAITLMGVIVLPRAVLAALAMRRARAWAAEFALPLQDPYFRRLARSHGGQPLHVVIVPYSYHASDRVIEGLQSVLSAASGQSSSADVRRPVRQDTTEINTLLPSDGSLTVLLFALTATPERETHGRFIEAVREAAIAPVLIVVDESAFRQRFDDGEGRRVRERTAAWQRMMDEIHQKAVFMDLTSPGFGQIEASLAPFLAEVTR